ncbi:MAG: hypothetical protein FWD47_14500 [Treponema sp.]|nr:hypothetical protein [Treponema sp.]
MNENRRITIVNNEFSVNGRKIWINGANTPWHNWDDFGGNYNNDWWDKHFAKLHDAGINASRVWINCNNANGALIINNDGIITGASEKHWEDLDQFFQIAAKNQIYILASILSHDHFKNTGTRSEAFKWRNMFCSNETVMSFAQNYTIPFIKRYGDNPYLWSIDICNEPEWIYENIECGQLTWEQISYFLAVNAAAIHENSKILVTVGAGFPKYCSDYNNNRGNKFSDSFFQTLYPNKNAYLDFWSVHYFDWEGPYYSVPFYISPYGSLPDGFGLDISKPAIIEECVARGSKGETKGTENNTIITDYENAIKNGWQGVMPWTSNSVDENGDFSDFSSAAKYMIEKYRELVFPFP